MTVSYVPCSLDDLVGEGTAILVAFPHQPPEWEQIIVSDTLGLHSRIAGFRRAPVQIKALFKSGLIPHRDGVLVHVLLDDRRESRLPHKIVIFLFAVTY